MNKGMNMTNMPYEIDVVSWDDLSDEGHIEFVDDYVSDLRAQGFDAQVVTYHGPAGGAAVVRFGPGTRSFNELNEFIVETYDPDWFEYQVETA